MRSLNNGRGMIRRRASGQPFTWDHMPVPDADPSGWGFNILKDLVDAYESGRPSLGNVEVTHHITRGVYRHRGEPPARRDVGVAAPREPRPLRVPRMTMETAPSADTKQELMRGRGMVAGTIVVGHAIKHLYNSGQSSLIMPEISRDLKPDTCPVRIARLGQPGCLVVRYDGGGLPRRPVQQPRRPHDRHLPVADGRRDDAGGFRPHLRHHAGGHVPGRDRPGDVSTPRRWGSSPAGSRTAAGSPYRCTAWLRT